MGRSSQRKAESGEAAKKKEREEPSEEVGGDTRLGRLLALQGMLEQIAKLVAAEIRDASMA